MFRVIPGVLYSLLCGAQATALVYIYCNYLVGREENQYIYFIVLPPNWSFTHAII